MNVLSALPAYCGQIETVCETVVFNKIFNCKTYDKLTGSLNVNF